MVLFGITGAFIYKAINTLDSMVGYRNEKYENYGKVSAKLDDLVNYIPARITAILIALLFSYKKKHYLTFTNLVLNMIVLMQVILFQHGYSY